ncbi:hypothetical protein GCM10023259_002270 [Thermocatellispora tengchongensis]
MIGAAAGALAVCAAVVPIARSANEAAPGPASCPQRWGGTDAGGWVPAAGAGGAGESLVPGEPEAAMICAYPGDTARTGGERLAGSRIIPAEGARAIARDLGYLPAARVAPTGPCTLIGGPMTNYLIRFAYPDGDALWIGTAEEPNQCVNTTNGTLTSRSYVGSHVTAAYRTGVWRPVRSEDPCRETTGRRGQDERMVPGEPVSVIVCGRPASHGARPPRSEHGAPAATALAAALNSPPVRRSENMCQGIPDAKPREFQLVFGYADGPPALVRVSTGCTPGVDNGLLQAELHDTVRAHLERLAPPG